ncbi:MAG: amidohydrolase family protein [Chromatiales bacterium]|nr:amidohydrolase family protein [Chromatiales bacterium]
MSARVVTLALLGVAMASGCAQGPAVIQADHAFTNVSLVDPETGRIELARTVLVRDGRILAIDDARRLQPGPGTRVIEGEGRYLMPGLAEMHAHVPEEREGRQYLEDVLFLWVAHGVTTVRGMRGADYHLDVREEIARGELTGPRLVTSGASFLGNTVPDAAAARAMAEAQAQAGFDFFKVHMGLSREAYDAVVEVARERGLPFGGHVADEVGIEHALASGQVSVDHLDGYMQLLVDPAADLAGIQGGFMGMPLTPWVDRSRFDEVARLTREAGTWNGPTLTMAENFVLPDGVRPERPGLEYMPRGVLLSWQRMGGAMQRGETYDPEMAVRFVEYRRQFVRALHESGAGLLLASDAPQVLNVPGFSTHEELDALVEAGLSPAEALATGTVNAARFLGMEDRFGRIAEGLEADLVLAAANPLVDIGTLRQPLGVMLRGRWLDRAELEAGLAAIAARQAATPEGGGDARP